MSYRPILPIAGVPDELLRAINDRLREMSEALPAGGKDQISYSSLSGLPKLGTAASRDVGTTVGTVAAGDDPRLSSVRVPAPHAPTHKHGGSDEVAVAVAAANAIPKADGTGKLAAGWIPTHATTHKNGGTDEIATETAGANAIPKAGAGGTLATGWIPDLSATYKTVASLATWTGSSNITTVGALSTLTVGGVVYLNSSSDNWLIFRNGTNQQLVLQNSADGSAWIKNRQNSYLAFTTNDSERLRIASGGNILVASTADDGSGSKVQVTGSINASAGYKVNGTAGATGTFKSGDAVQKTITVTNGIITGIV